MHDISPGLAQSWLALQCQMIPDVESALVLIAAPHQPLEAESLVCWPPGSEPDLALAKAARELLNPTPERSTTPNEPLPESSGRLLARVLGGDAQPSAAFALRTKRDYTQSKAVLTQLIDWGNAWLSFVNTQRSDAHHRQAIVVESACVVLQHERYRAAATALATHLAEHFGCERVTIGCARNGHVDVRALSNSAAFDNRTSLLHNLAGAMQEAVADGDSVLFPQATRRPLQRTLAHETLANRFGVGGVCTVLICDSAVCVGAITMERPGNSYFSEEDLALCEDIAAFAGPLLELKRRRDRTLVERMRDKLSAFSRAAFGERLSVGKSLAVLCCFAVVMALLFRGEHKVAAPATLEGVVHRALVAPLDGFIETQYAKAGDVVEKGALLATLDDRDLNIARRKWIGERDELLKEHRQAVARLERSQANILQAKMEKAQAEIDLVDEQLARTRIVAPIDGLIVQGDLRRSLGAPVERGEVLFELAPLAGYRVALEVSDTQIADVTVGARGQLTLAAIPNQRFAFSVDNVSGIATTRDERNAFRVEALLETDRKTLRPGMVGVGKVVVGEARLLWIWTHRLVRWLSLWVWSHWP